MSEQRKAVHLCVWGGGEPLRKLTAEPSTSTFHFPCDSWPSAAITATAWCCILHTDQGEHTFELL